MKHIYQLEQDSAFDASVWRDYPMEKSALLPRILYLDRFRGERKQRPLSAHSHWEFIGVLAGTGHLEGETVQELKENRVVLIPPGVTHREEGKGVMELLWLGFDADFSPDFPRESAMAVESEGLLNAFHDFWRFSVGHCEGIQLELQGRLLSMIGCFRRIFQAESSAGRPKIAAALCYLQDHYAEEIDMGKLAREIGLGESHFYREFKHLTGKTPVTYLTERRLSQSVLYLRETDFTVARIARLCGFGDPFYFSRVFRRCMGVPPQKYRSCSDANRPVIPVGTG